MLVHVGKGRILHSRFRHDCGGNNASINTNQGTLSTCIGGFVSFELGVRTTRITKLSASHIFRGRRSRCHHYLVGSCLASRRATRRRTQRCCSGVGSNQHTNQMCIGRVFGCLPRGVSNRALHRVRSEVSSVCETLTGRKKTIPSFSTYIRRFSSRGGTF